jgi:hypothetical protein
LTFGAYFAIVPPLFKTRPIRRASVVSTQLKAKPHKGIVVKVNAVVDEGIAPLVLALNEIPCVYTIDSCQGRQDKPAYVYFRYLGREEREPSFFADLAKAMARRCGREILYRIRLEWNSGDQPLGIVECPQGAIRRVASIINAASSDDSLTVYLRGKR